MKKAICAGLMAFVALGVRATVVPGVMGDSFSEAKDYAEANNVPLVLIWGNVYKGEKCEYCEALETALESPEAKAKMRELGYVFCHVWSTQSESSAARRFIEQHGTTKMSGYPLVCAYWKQGDGTVAEDHFSGRDPNNKNKPMTADQFFTKVAEIVGDYGKAASFLVGNTAQDRLEAVPGKTTRVFVPLKDFKDSDRAAYQIVAKFPRGGGQVTSSDQWIAIPTGVDFQPGDVVTLELLKDKEVVDTSAITFVAEPANGPANPYWIGEKPALEAGDWSMDIDAVKAAVKAGRAKYAAVFFTGALWCPHCRGLEDFVFMTAEGRKWAKDNKVVFAVLDNPKRSADPNPTKPNGDPPTLLRYQAALKAVSFDQTLPSGAGYLSRKGLAAGTATEAILQRNHTLGYPGGLYATPEATRTGYPTLIMLDAAAEKPMGRFVRLEEKKPGVSDYWHDPVEHLRRLNDFLLLRDGEGERNSYASMTTLRHEVGCYNKGKAKLQLNDRIRVYNLDGLEPGTLTIQASHSKKGLGVSIELLVAGASVASGTDELVYKVRRGDIEKGVQLRINAYPDTSVKLGESSVCTVNFTDEFEPSPVVDEATLPMGFAANICLEEIEADGEVRSVSVKRTGKLPSGLTLKYDKTTQSIVLSGKPSKAVPECAFTYTYTITYRDGRKVTSEPVEVTVKTFDPSTLNPYLGVAQNRTIPIVSSEKKLVGTLTVTTTAKGAVTAKYAGGSTVTFRGNWTELVDDTAAADLSTKKGEKLRLVLDSDGLMTAILTDVDGFDSIDGLSSVLTTVGFEAFKGVYTVVLRDESGLGGNGYLTLKMTSSSQIKKGTVSYSGLLADGTTVSGSAQLSGAGFDEVEGLGLCECAELPIFKKTSKLDVRLVLRIRANGEMTHLDEENSWAHVVHASNAAIPLANGAVVGPYGVWFETNRKLSDWQSLYPRIGDTFALKLGDVQVAKAIATGTKVTLSEKLGTVSLSYAKGTGIISGRMKFVLAGATLNGTWKGVVLPGWHYDCGCGGDDPALPFGMGTFYYTDRSSGKSVKASLPVALEILDEGK